MNADSPGENVSPSSPAPACGPDDARDSSAANAAGGFLDQFDRIVMMIELIARLPDLAEDVGNWRPLSLAEYSRAAGDGAAIDGYGALSPVARHAFDAVVAGLVMLGSAAAALCENAGGRLSHDEIVACREIGVVMGRLLERATALFETAEDSRFDADRAPLDRSSAQKMAG